MVVNFSLDNERASFAFFFSTGAKTVESAKRMLGLDFKTSLEYRDLTDV